MTNRTLVIVLAVVAIVAVGVYVMHAHGMTPNVVIRTIHGR